MASPLSKDIVLESAPSVRRVCGLSQRARAEKLTGTEDGIGAGGVMSELESEQEDSRTRLRIQPANR